MKSRWFLKYILGWLHAHDLLISSVHLRFPPLLSYKLTSINHVTPSNILQYSCTHIRPLIRSGHSTYSGYPPILGIVMSRPYLCPYRDACIPIIAVPRCLTVRVASHHFPPTTSGNCSHQPAFSISHPLRMSRLFPLLLGHFLSTLLLTILYYGVLCKLLGQFNGSLPQSIAVGCTHNCGHDQHLDLFTGSSLSEIEIEYLY